VLDNLLFDQGSALAGVLDVPELSFIHGDLREPEALEPALEGATDVVLLAALVGDPCCSTYPEEARAVNVDGARLLLDSIEGRGIDRFVFTSTCSNYGLRETDEPATEESELAPLSLYAETKVEFEHEVLGRVERVDFAPTILRLSTAYGLSDRMRFDLTISEFARTLAMGEELVVFDADTWRPYCHVADISRAIAWALDADRGAVTGEVFNVGHDDENYTKRMVVDAALERLGGEGRVDYEEGGRDPRNYRVSFEKIHSLGFEPQRRMPDAVGRLIEAVRAGAFGDVDQRRRFYTNHELATTKVAAAGADEG
jgi:nucleoside-diphosphate-sugar epimerase